MLTRRAFVHSGAMGVIASAVAPLVTLASASGTTEVQQSTSRGSKPSPVTRIRSAIRRQDSITRYGGDAGFGGLTWTDDDRQLVFASDGFGFDTRFCSTILYSIEGSARHARFDKVPTYPEMPNFAWMREGQVPYYGWTQLAVDGRVYQYLSTNKLLKVKGEPSDWNVGYEFNAAKLIYSPDNGRTWCDQNGSPFVHEREAQLSGRDLTFLREPQNVFSMPTFLQMGKGYEDNQDGYVYVYSGNGGYSVTGDASEDEMNGAPVGQPNELVMFRVPKQEVLSRPAFEYFAGLQADGTARWAKDINARASVHQFRHRGSGYSLPISAVYNAPLGVYMLLSGGALPSSHVQPNSYLGIWIAQNPWGPWTQIHEEAGSALPVGSIAPKWIAKDGKSFWVVWSSESKTRMPAKGVDPEDAAGYYASTEQEMVRQRRRWHDYHTNFAFNAQRFDLII